MHRCAKAPLITGPTIAVGIIFLDNIIVKIAEVAVASRAAFARYDVARTENESRDVFLLYAADGPSASDDYDDNNNYNNYNDG